MPLPYILFTYMQLYNALTFSKSKHLCQEALRRAINSPIKKEDAHAVQDHQLLFSRLHVGSRKSMYITKAKLEQFSLSKTCFHRANQDALIREVFFKSSSSCG